MALIPAVIVGLNLDGPVLVIPVVNRISWESWKVCTNAIVVEDMVVPYNENYYRDNYIEKLSIPRKFWFIRFNHDL